MKKLNKLLEKTIQNDLFVMEMSFFIGLIIIIISNFMISLYFGAYFLGIIFIIYSVFLHRFPRR